MIRVITTHEPILERASSLSHPDLPGEQVVLIVRRRVATSIFGVYVSHDLSGAAIGSYSGREIPAADWTPELRDAFDRLSREAPKPSKRFTMSAAGVVLSIIMVLASAALAWGLAQPWLAARSSATAEDAMARVESVFEAPSEGALLLMSEPSGTEFRWYRVSSVEAASVELEGSAETFDLTYGIVDPSELSFEGPSLSIPREHFEQDGGVLNLDGSVRLVSNARP